MNENTFPFTKEQLERFRNEIDEAGSFEKLMIKKRALVRRDGQKCIAYYYDMERYKRIHLNGVYESLHPMYETVMPYVFWSDMYEILQQSEAKKI